jgi:hypothetical protein
VLRILEPVRSLDATYDGHIPAPAEGDLVRAPGGQPFALRVIDGKSYAKAAMSLLGSDHGYVISHREGSFTGRSIRFILRHLSDRSLTTEDFVDLSGLKVADVSVCNGQERRHWDVRYHEYVKEDKTPCKVPFPTGCRGFFFFYYHPRPASLIRDQIRFRITSSRDPAFFAAGRDLLLPSGMPWKQNIPALFRDERSPLQEVLVSDGLVSQQDIDLWRTQYRPAFSAHSDVVSLRDPFLIDLSKKCRMLSIPHGMKANRYELGLPFCMRLGGKYVYPYRGKQCRKVYAAEARPS